MTATDSTPSIQPPFRRATSDDAGALAEFVEFASEGLALYLWSKIAGSGVDPWHIGRERVRDEANPIFHGNAVITDLAQRPAAGMISYPADSKAGPVSDELPAVLVPLQDLMNQATDTWHVHVLAGYPQYRGRGLGTALLALADRFAASAGKPGLSLIVSDTNTNARRLYESCGYRDVAQRKMIKEQWQHPGVDWVLLRKTL
jgi:ribosomal protein S18 acetylase RimI-like enzyme